MKRLALAIGAAVIIASPVGAADLFTPSSSDGGLIGDIRARQVGDSLTVVIYENSLASSSVQGGSRRSAKIGATAAAGGNSPQTADINLSSSFDGAGQTGRVGKLVAQISVVVDGVLPNGDLHVSGQQALNVNGEHNLIRVSGRVRQVDISSANTVVSTRLAEAQIDYAGSGLISKGVRPGIISRIGLMLGLP